MIIAKGLAKKFVGFVEGRFREIQDSYKKTRNERNF
jgi:hypothetical protein